ncbi:MAG TPA: hypothetical protein VJZ50_08385, partial [Candidatus Limnocylindrales bacterium]|nr:hypothetical protein [Candidatus Limnocylindrales bacterium]
TSRDISDRSADRRGPPPVRPGASNPSDRLMLALGSSSSIILLISDDLDELLRLADRIVVMRRGRPEAPVEAASIDRADLLAAISDVGGALAA